MGALARKRKDTVRLRLVRDPMEEPHQSRVRLVTLFNSVDIQKDYHNCTLVYDGRRIRKLVPWSEDALEPSKEEWKQFVMDILRAARDDKGISEYIRQNPFPFMGRRET